MAELIDGRAVNVATRTGPVDVSNFVYIGNKTCNRFFNL
jgi:hypothetical protein